MPESKELLLRSEVEYLMRCIFWMKDFSDGRILHLLSRYSTLSYHGPIGWEGKDNFVYFNVKLILFSDYFHKKHFKLFNLEICLTFDNILTFYN